MRVTRPDHTSYLLVLGNQKTAWDLVARASYLERTAPHQVLAARAAEPLMQHQGIARTDLSLNLYWLVLQNSTPSLVREIAQGWEQRSLGEGHMSDSMTMSRVGVRMAALPVLAYW